MDWPDDKEFAFTIFDDTDGGKLKRIEPMYDFLKSCGIYTTKSVWPLDDPEGPGWKGPSLEDGTFLEWVKRLEAEGFEIGYHGASFGNNERARVRKALAVFEELFGSDGIVYANHFGNMEAIYYHEAKVSGVARWAYGLMTRFKTWRRSKGHREGSPYFWGDICRAKMKYVRGPVFRDINTLKQCPSMPYYDSTRPFVRAWFASSEGRDADTFCRLLSPPNQERLQQEKGCCIVYTHFAYHFVRDGNVRKDVRDLISQLSERNGWFAPVGTILSYLENTNGGVHSLSRKERNKLEWKWLANKVLIGSA